MDEREILKSIKTSIDNVPIDLLEKIKAQQKIKMTEHDEITMQKKRKKGISKFIPYASVAMIFFFVVLNWHLNNNVMYSKIYLDVNPSISIEVNKKENVIALFAVNKDGKRIVKGIDYKGKSVYLITDELMNRMIQENYISKADQFLLLSVYNKNEKKARIQKDKLENNLYQYMEEKAIEPIVLTQELKHNAKEKFTEDGVSTGKTVFIEKMKLLNSDFKVENLKVLSIRELVNLSQKNKLDLKKIIESKDFKKIESIYIENDDKEQPEEEIKEDIEEKEDKEDEEDEEDKEVKEDKEDKEENQKAANLEQVFKLLSKDEKKLIDNGYKDGEISKFIITSSNKKFREVTPAYYNTSVYLVSFPTNLSEGDDFIVLCNLEMNKIVGYGVIE